MKKVIEFVKEFSDAVTLSKVGVYAASTAFFVFMSLIPFFMLLCSMLPYANVDVTTLKGYVNEIAPEYITEFIDDIFVQSSKGNAAVISLSALITLWVAGKGVWALSCGLDSVYGFTKKKNLLKHRIISSFYTIIFLALIVFLLGITVYGNVYFYIIANKFSQIPVMYEIFKDIRFVVAWFVFILIFQLMYTIIPSIRLRFSWQFPGALFASLGWLLFSYGFSLYLKYFSDFSMYGSFTTIIIAMFWLYYCMYIFLFGALINQFCRPLLKKMKKNRHNKEKAGKSGQSKINENAEETENAEENF